MFFLSRLATATSNLLHVSAGLETSLSHCQLPWTEIQEAASDPGALSQGLGGERCGGGA